MDKVKNILTIALKAVVSVFITVIGLTGAVLICVGLPLLELAMTLEDKGWVLRLKKRT